MTATSTSSGSFVPLMCDIGKWSIPIRTIPVELVWSNKVTGPSASTNKTRASAYKFRIVATSSSAAKPLRASYLIAGTSWNSFSSASMSTPSRQVTIHNG